MKSKIEWASKLVDLLIVVIGITIAFQLDNWNQARITNAEVRSYVKSFYNETNVNHDELATGLTFLKSKKQSIDSLEQNLTSKSYSSKRIKFLVADMTSLPDFNPTTITMQSIASSGKLDQIGSMDLRKDIIRSYDAYKETKNLESLLTDFQNQYIMPFIFKNVRLTNFNSMQSDFIRNPLFENYVIGYDVLLNQLIKGYEKNLKSVNQLTQKLTAAEKH